MYFILSVEWAIDHFVIGLTKKSIHVSHRYAQKRFLHFRSQWPWPFTFRSQIYSPSYSCPAPHSTKLEVSSALLFQEIRMHVMDGRINRETDGRRGCNN